MTIPASADAVWRVLVDFDSYPEWSRFILKVRGQATPGTRLRVSMCPPGSRPMTFRPRVIAAEPGRRLAWLGHLLLPGIFDGLHEFVLEPAGAGATVVIHRERLTGVLPPLMGGILDRTETGFKAFNAALHDRVRGTVTTI